MALTLLALFIVGCALSFLPAPVQAQSFGTLIVDANPDECASIYVSEEGYSASDFTSFPGYFNIESFLSPITITVTAEDGYTFSYAATDSASYLGNPFQDTFYGDIDLTFYFTETPSPTPTPDPSATPPPSPTGYGYTLNGLYDENNPASQLGSVIVTAYYANGSVGIGGRSTEIFTVNGTYSYLPPSKPLYFSFDLSAHYSVNMTRRYWLGLGEDTADITIFATNTDLSLIAFSIFNYRNIDAFASGAILTARSLTSLEAIDRRLTDSLGTVTLELQPNTLYDITVESLSTGAVYDLGPINTATSVITLNVPLLAFPPNIVDLYTYSYAWATRNFTSSSITVAYQDTTGQTSSLEIIISDASNSTVYFDETYSNDTQNVNLFSYTWSFAVNATDYNVWVLVTSETTGEYYFKQYLGGEYTKAVSPFDFSFLGNINGLDMAIFIPAFLIICAAGVFSQLSAEVACFLTTVTAIILTLIGWISISSSMLVVALSLSLLAGVVTARRRFG